MTNAMMRNGFYGEELDLDQLDMVNGGGFWDVVDKITDYVPVVRQAKRFGKDLYNTLSDKNITVGKGIFKSLTSMATNLVTGTIDALTFGAETVVESGAEAINDAVND